MIKKHPLASFFALAYGISWLIEFPLALQARGIIQQIFPVSLHYLAGYGPLIAALIVTGVVAGKDGIRKIWGQMTRWRVRLFWWFVAVSPLIMYFLSF